MLQVYQELLNLGIKMNIFWIYAHSFHETYIPMFLSTDGLSTGIPFITYNLDQIIRHFQETKNEAQT